MGYSETREEKLGFVEIRSKPARVAPAPPKVDQATLIQRLHRKHNNQLYGVLAAILKVWNRSGICFSIKDICVNLIKLIFLEI